MDVSKLLAFATLIAIYNTTGTSGGKGWGKHHHKYPVKPLFGVGVGYKKVVSYKPVLVFQKHKHIKLKKPIGWGWAWGWRPQHHHGGHHGGGHQRGHSGGGWGGGHKHQVGKYHHHYHHNDNGWGWDNGNEGSSVGSGGWGWGDRGGGGDDEHEDYGGWESNLKANWSSPTAPNNNNGKMEDQMPGYSENGSRPQGKEADFHHGENNKGHTSSEEQDKNANNGEEILYQNPPPPPPQPQQNQNQWGGYRNYANFNMGHPISPPVFIVPNKKNRKLKRGVSVPIVPFLPFPGGNLQQFQHNSRVRQF